MNENFKTKWTDEEDDLLKNTVLETVRNGQTQLAAFETVALRTNRTAGTVAFRWNSKVRKECSAELKQAKEESKKKRNKDSIAGEIGEPVRSANIQKSNKVTVIVNTEQKEKNKNESISLIGYDDVIEFINEKRQLDEKFIGLSQAFDILTIEYESLKQSFEEVVALVEKIKNA